MGQVLIRNIRDDVLESCKVQARLNGTSLENFLRGLIEDNSPIPAEKALELSQRFTSEIKGSLAPLTKEDMREGLE